MNHVYPLPAVALTVALWGSALGHASEAPRIPVEFGECPRKLVPFLKYIVARRAAEGLNRITPGAPTPKQVTIYGGAAEDANVAWIAATAYKESWSRYHKNEVVRRRAFAMLDALCGVYPDGNWDDGGLNAYFGLQSEAWAVLEWMDSGDVDQARAQRWRRHVRLTADHAMRCMHYGPYRPSALAGQYANPEMYYLSGLAAAWKLTGERTYRDEAGRALRRYDDWLYPGGGVAYFVRSSPQHGYQHMVAKSVALYWDLTGDAYARAFLKRLAPYFPNVQHRSGLMTGAELPYLKHAWHHFLNPAMGAMLACATGDGANRWAADVATPLFADGVMQRFPSFGKKHHWYNYHLTTYAAGALRLMKRHALPKPKAPPARRVFVDRSFRGVRSHWDDFTAAQGTHQMNDSLAGAYLADPKEPTLPLGAAVDGVYFEVLSGKPHGKRADRRRAFRCVEWDPTVHITATDRIAAVSCLTRLCNPYWGDMPFLPGENGHNSQFADWTSLQHWAVWRDHLIGLGSLRCHGDGGRTDWHDAARVRWRLSPHNREHKVLKADGDRLRFRFGALQVDLLRLDERGGFAFAPAEMTDAPRYAWTPLLVRPAPWKAGDFVHVATVIHPVGAKGQVHVKALDRGAAAVLIEPDGTRAIVWIANLGRHWHQYLLNLPAGVRCRTFTRHVELAPVPAGEPANVGLLGAQNAVWVLDADKPMSVKSLLDGLRSGKGR